MTLYWEQDTEYIELVQDLLDSDEVKQLESFVHHKVTNRFNHSISVSYRSYRWAKRLKLNTRAIARAGLLHDLFFYESADKNGVGGRGHNYEHPRIALQNAEALTELTDLERDIILKHMFGATSAMPKYKESWIVTLMDKHCAVAEVSTGIRERLAANLRITSNTLARQLRPLFLGFDAIDESVLTQYNNQ